MELSLSYSYWLDQTIKKKSKSFDVVIVGAGVAGASLSYWLHKEDPSLKIAIVDKTEVAGGATGRNAGFITCGSVEHFNRLVEQQGEERAHEIWQFSEKNLELLKSEIIGKEIQRMSFNQCGSFSLASEKSEMEELLRTAQLMEKLNISVEVVEEEGVRQRLGAEGFVGGIKYIDDACVNPVQLVKRILSQTPTEIFEYTEVSSIEEGPAGLRQLHTNKGLFETPVIILAANGYLPSLNPYFREKVYPTRGQILLTEPVGKFMEAPCYAHFVLDYFRQLPTGELLIGGFRQLDRENEVGYSDHITDKIQEALYDFVKTHLPAFTDKKVTHRWAGVMGFSADGQQMIGALPEDSQIFFMGGFTAHGLGLAFHTAKCLVDLIFGRPIPDFISARRF